jgi:hypothetical protein
MTASTASGCWRERSFQREYAVLPAIPVAGAGVLDVPVTGVLVVDVPVAGVPVVSVTVPHGH